MSLQFQAGKTASQNKSIQFLDQNANLEWEIRFLPREGFHIDNGTFNLLHSTGSTTRLESPSGGSTILIGDIIDWQDVAGHLRARMYAAGGGTLAEFNTASPDFAGATANNYMALYTTGADTWAIGATGNPTANPISLIITFADSGNVTTVSGQLISTVATGTAPLSVASTTPVANPALVADSQLPTISTAGKVADSALSSNIPRLNQANTYSAGAKQTFQNSASTAGLNLASSADPSSPRQGDVWINASDLKFRGAAATGAKDLLGQLLGGSNLYGFGASPPDLGALDPTLMGFGRRGR